MAGSSWLRQTFVKEVRKQGAYASPDGTEVVPIIKASGSETIGYVTLTNLIAAVSSFTGVKTFGSMPVIPVAAVVAVGTNLATAAQLTAGFSVVSAADDTVGVKLPATPAAGTICIVKSTVSNKILKVWPDAAATINAIGSNAAISLASGPTPAIFIASSATQWWTLPLLPS